jgi:hypothetical protein
MRHLVFGCVIWAASLAPASAADATGPAPAPAVFTVRQIQILAQAPVPAGVPREAQRLPTNAVFTVAYLIEGTGIIGFDEDALAIDGVVGGGVEQPAVAKGMTTAFTGVSGGGRFGYYSLDGKDPVTFGHLDDLAVRGTIAVRVGEGAVSATTAAHALSGGEREAVGEYQVAFGGTIPQANYEQAPGAVITVFGDLKTLGGMTLVVDGKEQACDEDFANQQYGYTSFMFPQVPRAAVGTVQVLSWRRSRVVAVALGGAHGAVTATATGAEVAAEPGKDF